MVALCGRFAGGQSRERAEPRQCFPRARQHRNQRRHAHAQPRVRDRHKHDSHCLQRQPVSGQWQSRQPDRWHALLQSRQRDNVVQRRARLRQSERQQQVLAREFWHVGVRRGRRDPVLPGCHLRRPRHDLCLRRRQHHQNDRHAIRGRRRPVHDPQSRGVHLPRQQSRGERDERDVYYQGGLHR